MVRPAAWTARITPVACLSLIAAIASGGSDDDSRAPAKLSASAERDTSVRPTAYGLAMPRRVRDLIRLVEDDGWYLVGQTGSHRQYKHATKPGRVTIAGKPSVEVPPKTEKSILRQAGLEGGGRHER